MTVSSQFLLAQLETLVALGLPLDTSLSVMELTAKDLTDPRRRIAVDDVLTLLNHAETALKDPLIGLRVGYKFRINAFSQTGNIFSYCQDMHQVIAANARFQCLAIDAGTAAYHATGTTEAPRHFMTFTPYYTDMARYRHITDMVMGAYGTAYRWLSWASGEDLKAAALPYSAPDNIDFYRDVFDCTLNFDAKTPSIELADAAMMTPLATADAEKYARTNAQLETMLSTTQDAGCLRDAVETAIGGAMNIGPVTIDTVAARLMKKPHALRSEMKAAKINYRQTLNEVRQTKFKTLFAQGESFAAIAQALAYNDQAAFSRAFRGWYGCAPGQWAKENEAKQHP